MSFAPSIVPRESLTDRMLDLVRAQQEALRAGDADAFTRLVAERWPLQEALLAEAADAPTAADRDRIRQTLQRVAEFDRAAVARIQQLMDEVSGALMQMRRGRSALHGYGRTNGRSASLDLVG
jgi:hypothetical protein